MLHNSQQLNMSVDMHETKQNKITKYSIPKCA